jgi:hypothetical protein
MIVVLTKKGVHFLYGGRQVLVLCFVHFPRLHASLCVCVITCNIQRRCGNTVVHLAGVSSLYSEKSLVLVIFFFFWSGVRLSPLGTSATNWPIVPAPDNTRWWVWSSRWNENWHRITRSNLAPVPLCPPQIPHDDLGSNPDHRSGKPATNRLKLWHGLKSH